MKKRSNLISMGALAAIFLLPMLNKKTKRKISRYSRDALCKANDYLQDVIEMNK